jgi:transmembrane sensor
VGEPPIRAVAAEAEAADWFARLGTRNVSASTLEAFQAWRSRPENAAAYRRLEGLWAEAGELRSDPDIQAALRATAARTSTRSARRGIAPAGLAVAGLVVLIAAGGVYLRQGRGVFTTAVGEQRLVQLEDGSTVRLDTASRVRVRYTSQQRRIDLVQGRALFTVASAPTRPFTVAAGRTAVTATGTVFDVRRDPALVSVTLVAGRVEVVSPQNGRAPAAMTAGQQLVVTAGDFQTRPVDPTAETSWAEGRLVFREAGLGAAVDEVNRYLTHKITLDAPSLRSVEVTGVFQTGDREAFVAAATDLFGLVAVPGPQGSVTLTNRAEKSRTAPGSPRG